MEVKQKAALIYNAIEDKKGSRISVLDISGISVMADYFVIADAENNNQLQAIADNVEEQMMKNGNHGRFIIYSTKRPYLWRKISKDTVFLAFKKQSLDGTD